MKKRLTYPVHAIYPAVGLIPSFILLLINSAPMKPLFVGTVLLAIMQYLFNTSHASNRQLGKNREKQASEQFNDPAFAAQVSQGSQRGVVFMPTNDIRSSDAQKVIAASWIVVIMTALFAFITAYDHTGIFPGKAVYVPLAASLMIIFIAEQITAKHQ